MDFFRGKNFRILFLLMIIIYLLFFIKIKIEIQRKWVCARPPYLFLFIYRNILRFFFIFKRLKHQIVVLNLYIYNSNLFILHIINQSLKFYLCRGSMPLNNFYFYDIIIQTYIITFTQHDKKLKLNIQIIDTS